MRVTASVSGVRKKGAPYPYRHKIQGVGVPGSTDVIDDLGLRFDYGMVRPDVLKAAGERGSRVHDAIAWALTGSSDEEASAGLIETDRGYFDGWLAWRELARPEPLLVEHEVLVPGWPPYGGTLDFLGNTVSGPRLSDWKCRAGIEGDGLQTVSYQRGVLLTATDPEVLEMARHCRRQSVELRKNGTYKVHPHNDPLDLRRFVAALITWHYKIGQGWEPKKV